MTSKNLTGQQVVLEARSWIGTPYIHQASKKGLGCDCLGLVRGLWRALIGDEPEATPAYSSNWAERGGKEQLLTAANAHFLPVERHKILPGDVILFRLRAKSPAKHLGVFTGNNRFVHAYDGASVVESALDEFWARHIHSVHRFPGVTN